jgi:Protein of unknown function (DUF3037)
VPAEPRNPYQYALIQVVPHVERDERINAGVVLLCRSKAFVGALTALDDARLRAIAPDADPATIRPHLDAIERIARGDERGGPIARLPIAQRFHWLVSPASTIIQPSPVHTGLTDDPAIELQRLFEALVR